MTIFTEIELTMSFIISEIPTISRVEDTIGEERTAADGENFAGRSCSIRVQIVQAHLLHITTSQNHSHAKARVLVGIDDIIHDFCGCSQGNLLLVAQFIQTALGGENAVPIRAISSSASQCS